MKVKLLRLRHWWQRNFGHVYLSETRGNGEIRCYRFKAWFGKVALCWWPCDFVCRLSPNGDIINHCWEKMRGFGKPYPGWKWSYEPVGSVIGKGGAW